MGLVAYPDLLGFDACRPWRVRVGVEDVTWATGEGERGWTVLDVDVDEIT